MRDVPLFMIPKEMPARYPLSFQSRVNSNSSSQVLQVSIHLYIYKPCKTSIIGWVKHTFAKEIRRLPGLCTTDDGTSGHPLNL